MKYYIDRSELTVCRTSIDTTFADTQTHTHTHTHTHLHTHTISSNNRPNESHSAMYYRYIRIFCVVVPDGMRFDRNKFRDSHE